MCTNHIQVYCGIIRFVMLVILYIKAVVKINDFAKCLILKPKDLWFGSSTRRGDEFISDPLEGAPKSCNVIKRGFQPMKLSFKKSHSDSKDFLHQSGGCITSKLLSYCKIYIAPSIQGLCYRCRKWGRERLGAGFFKALSNCLNWTVVKFLLTAMATELGQVYTPKVRVGLCEKTFPPSQHSYASKILCVVTAMQTEKCSCLHS